MFFGSWLGWTNKTARHCNVAGHMRSGSTFAYCYYICIAHCASKMQGTSIFALRKIMHRTTPQKMHFTAMWQTLHCNTDTTPAKQSLSLSSQYSVHQFSLAIKYSRPRKILSSVQRPYWAWKHTLILQWLSQIENTPSTRSLFKTLLEQKINCEPSCNHQCTILVRTPKPLSAGTYKSQRVTSSGNLPTILNVKRKHWPYFFLLVHTDENIWFWGYLIFVAC